MPMEKQICVSIFEIWWTLGQWMESSSQVKTTTPSHLAGGVSPDPKFQCWEEFGLADECEAACNGIEFASATAKPQH